MKNVNMINKKIKNIFLSSFKLYVDNILYISSIYMFILIISSISQYIINNFSGLYSIQYIIFYCSSQLFLSGLALGLIKSFLLVHRQCATTFSTLFSSFNLLFDYLLALIIMTLGMIIIILPGIMGLFISSNMLELLNQFPNELATKNFMIMDLDLIESSNFLIYNNFLFYLSCFCILISLIIIMCIGLKLQFYQYIIVDEECKGLEALKKSYHITNNKLNVLILFTLIILVMNVFGLLFFGIGILFTAPFSLLCLTKLYLDIKGNLI